MHFHPAPLSSRAKPTCPALPWRDLRFRGPFLGMFFDKPKRSERSTLHKRIPNEKCASDRIRLAIATV